MAGAAGSEWYSWTCPLPSERAGTQDTLRGCRVLWRENSSGGESPLGRSASQEGSQF